MIAGRRDAFSILLRNESDGKARGSAGTLTVEAIKPEGRGGRNFMVELSVDVMPRVVDYRDYRKFLADYYVYKKQTTCFFSYRYFSLKAGISSPSFFKKVVDGERNLTLSVMEKFCIALKLSPDDADFFRTLVRYNQAKSDEERDSLHAALEESLCILSRNELVATVDALCCDQGLLLVH